MLKQILKAYLVPFLVFVDSTSESHAYDHFRFNCLPISIFIFISTIYLGHLCHFSCSGTVLSSANATMPTTGEVASM